MVKKGEKGEKVQKVQSYITLTGFMCRCEQSLAGVRSIESGFRGQKHTHALIQQPSALLQYHMSMKYISMSLT